MSSAELSKARHFGFRVGLAVAAAGLLAAFFAAEALAEAQDSETPFVAADIWTDYGPYSARVMKIQDGDSYIMQIDGWPATYMQASIRLAGVDTPETRTKSACEKALGLAATAAVIQWMRVNAGAASINGVRVPGVVLQELKYDAFNASNLPRMRARVFGRTPEHDLAAWLVANGHARAYKKGDKTPWCVDGAPT